MSAMTVESEDDDPTLHLIEMWACELCLAGAGGECHSPGCAFYLNRAPDLPLHHNGRRYGPTR